MCAAPQWRSGCARVPRDSKPYELDTEGTVFRQGLNRIRVCVVDFATVGERNRACARHKARVDNDCPVDEGSEQGTIDARIAGTNPGTIRADRPATVEGTLTDGSGSAVVGARVCVATRTELGSAVEHVIATPRTGRAAGSTPGSTPVQAARSGSRTGPTRAASPSIICACGARPA